MIPIAFSPATAAGAPAPQGFSQSRNAVRQPFSALLQTAQANAPHDKTDEPEARPTTTGRKAIVKLAAPALNARPDTPVALVEALPAPQPKPYILHLFSSFARGEEPVAVDNPATRGIPDNAPEQSPALAAAPVAFSLSLHAVEPADQKPAPVSPRNSAQQAQPSLPATVPGQSEESSLPLDTGSRHSGNQEQKPDELKTPATGNTIKDEVAVTPHFETQSPQSFASPVAYTAPGAAPQHNAVKSVAAPLPAAPAELPAAPAPPAPRHIDLTVPNDAGHQVDLRISQRGGEVQVTVRTPDGNLAQSLRHHLPELSENLSRNGLRGEIFSAAQSQAPGEGKGGETPGGQQQQEQQNPAGQNQPATPRRTKGRESGSFAEMIHAEKRTN